VLRNNKILKHNTFVLLLQPERQSEMEPRADGGLATAAATLLMLAHRMLQNVATRECACGDVCGLAACIFKDCGVQGGKPRWALAE